MFQEFEKKITALEFEIRGKAASVESEVRTKVRELEERMQALFRVLVIFLVTLTTFVVTSLSWLVLAHYGWIPMLVIGFTTVAAFVIITSVLKEDKDNNKEE